MRGDSSVCNMCWTILSRFLHFLLVFVLMQPSKLLLFLRHGHDAVVTSEIHFNTRCIALDGVSGELGML
jgi:hypothetical protein